LFLPGTAVATSAILKLPIAGAPADSLTVGLTFGFTLVVLVFTFGHISGCHLNPAVTLGLAISGKFPWKYVPAYIVSQIGGSSLASCVVWYIYGKDARTKALLAVTQPAKSVTGRDIFTVESLATFFLVLVICAVATDDRVHPSVAGVAVGFTLFVGVLFAGPISGGAVNPARALGPMIVIGKFTDVWEYILGPISGGMVAALLYTKFLAKAEEPSQAEEQKEESD
jgi:MIP family channel proteins